MISQECREAGALRANEPEESRRLHMLCPDCNCPCQCVVDKGYNE